MTAEKFEFKTEVNQLLDLMIHSLYSHKEISIRELLSNASDALDKVRYEALTNPELMEQQGELKIRITADREAGTLTISDNGIGMTRQEAITALGTIAHSGTREFLNALKEKSVKDSPDLIGQFGVGFYSSYMISDRVTLVSRRAGAEDNSAISWESTADGTYTIEECTRKTAGTDVTLSIKAEEKDYLDEWRIREIVRKYSDYIEYPIMLEIEREEESALDKTNKVKVKKDEQINSGKAIWLRDKADVSESEHAEFYRHISHDFSDPLQSIHYRAEGTSEFTCLLYLPSHAPMDLFYKEFKMGPALYVRKVQIMDHCEELIPLYLRFIKGVVDSSDLPLNVSRELLQNNRQITVIKNNITKKVLETLAELKQNNAEKYLTFYREFGRVLKEGLHLDYARKETIADLLLFSSTHGGDGQRTLADYLAAMKEGQDEIYFITGQTEAEMKASPYLEVFTAKDYEVLFMTDEIDDYIFSGFEYKGKKFKSVLKGDITLDTAGKDEEKKAFAGLMEMLTASLKDDIKEVRLSGRLKDSPCCLVGEEGDMDPRMEKMLKAMGQEVPERKKVLEINPSHAVLQAMNRIYEKDRNAEVLQQYAALLLDQALLLSGLKPKDPVLFARNISRLMTESAEQHEGK